MTLVGGEPGALNRYLKPAETTARLIEGGMSAPSAHEKAGLFAAAAEALHDGGRNDNKHAIATWVPGRIEVMGKHTDYCGGRSLLMTVERGLCFVAVPRADQTIRVIDVTRGRQAEFPFDDNLKPTVGDWSNYPMTVARRVARNFPGGLRGADIAVAADLPLAAGLSSSSALIVGMFLCLSRANRLDERSAYTANIRSDADLAGYCGTIENGGTFGSLDGDTGVGTFGGSQDQTAILCCRAGKLSRYAFAPVRPEGEVDLPASLSFVVMDSGVVAEKTGAALHKYNAVARRARRLVELANEDFGQRFATLADVLNSSEIGVKGLRRVLVKHAAIDREEQLTSRLEQFVAESEELIPEACRLIAAGQFDRLGPVIDASQRLAETNLQNQIPETIALKWAARQLGAYAASAFGAGFGGSVWALVDTAKAEGLLRDWATACRDTVPEAKGFVSRPGPPVIAF